MKRVLVVFGTRPEAIKLAPVVLQLRARHPSLETRICVTAQHRDLLDPVLDLFGIRPDRDLNCMHPGQTLAQATARMLAALEPALEAETPDLVMVQGDTATTAAAAMAAFYARVPVAHVEAGLRTGDLAHPFPEEFNRVVVGRVAALHFAATSWAAGNLLREGVDPAAIAITGNTSVDSVLYVRGRLAEGCWPEARVPLDPARRLVLVTAHRRESFGARFERICDALAAIAERPDVEMIYPVHPNPDVRGPVYRRLAGAPRVRLIEPLGYAPFVWLLERAAVALTDSGGIQEEAPALGTPVLVMRDKTERPEAVESGAARLVGADRDRIVSECARVLDDPDTARAMALAGNPYGDGRAGMRIADGVAAFLARGSSSEATPGSRT
jgi:UDP-N-acetylglucosamine 2-epimerase